ncbi:MAG: DUF1015 domain-containing protein [Candidatus Omnitrophota bacterium]
MAHTIKPFQATYYNPSLIKNSSLVTCPPYDVIDEHQAEALRRKSPYNFCRILLALGGDYKALGRTFRSWLKEKVLVDDIDEALYLYEQRFIVEGKRCQRFGILSLLDMVGKNSIFPHEYTLKAPKEDRKKIIREMKANLSPIFVIAAKPIPYLRTLHGLYAKRKPFMEFKDLDGNANIIWKIDDKKHIEQICTAVDRAQLVIADGHHRFEVAYGYYKRNRGRFRHLNYILAYITDPQDGLVILPTHRIVTVPSTTEMFPSSIKEHFYVEKVNERLLHEKLKKSGDFAFGIYNGTFYYLRLKAPHILDTMFKGSAYRDLDTYLMHQFVFPLYNITGAIQYTHSIQEAKNMVCGNKVAFLLRSTPLGAIFKIANHGSRLPQKSTYFYPKVSSGIVTRRFKV